MRHFPEYPDSEDYVIKSLGLSVGCDNFLTAKSAMDEATDLANTIGAFGVDCDWINVYRKRLHQLGFEISIKKIEK